MNASSSGYPNQLAVKQAAEHLLLTNGQTTTLEVKLYLRQRGYLAYQRNISLIMNELAAMLDWEYYFNGVHRVYQYRLLTVADFHASLSVFSLN